MVKLCTKKLFLVRSLANQVPEVSVKEISDSIQNVQLLGRIVTVTLFEASISHRFGEFKVEDRRLAISFIENYIQVK